MARIHQTTTAALLACIIVTQCTGTLLASDDEHAAIPATSHLTYDGKPLALLGPLDADHLRIGGNPIAISPIESTAFSQWGWGGRRGRGRNRGAGTALFLGAVGAITGAAVLVYADRPDCNTNHALNGCGYGTKVIGGAVLSAGLVGLMIGALTWR
jgi:hypothetical protein